MPDTMGVMSSADLQVDPVLVRTDHAREVKAIALVLHGGQEVSRTPVGPRQLAVLRMLPIARRLARQAGPQGVGVWRLRFRYRGWNDAADPVADVRWAVRRLRDQQAGVPIVLVGHSMGGRAALRAAGEPGVVAVLGLAPWVPGSDPHSQLAGRQVLVIHGARDRMTSPKTSKELVDRIRGQALEATYVSMRFSGHAMLRRAALWNALTTDFVLYAGLGAAPTPRLARLLASRDSAL
jgi:pimeloyl-ACP methyl ester carboxylesterase